jgi:hypothetical protein
MSAASSESVVPAHGHVLHRDFSARVVIHRHAGRSIARRLTCDANRWTMEAPRKEVAVPHTQYHPHVVPTPEPDDDDDVELIADDRHDGLVPPDISDDPEHDRLIDPQD